MFFPLSLTARVTLTAVAAIFFGLGLFATHMLAVLQRDLTDLVGTQLAAQADYVVAEMDEEFQLRTRVLQEIASAITPTLLADPPRMQRFLDQRAPSSAMFPNGIVATDKDGRVIAHHPSDNLAFRQGNLGDRGYFRQLMVENRPQIGPPTLGRFFGKPIVVVAVPLRDQHGAAAGMLAGPALLSDADLFGRIEKAKLGRSGKILVMSSRDNLMVSATAGDKTRIMQALPARGANPLLDRRRNEGFDGTGLTVDSLGVETVSVSRSMKTTGWLVLASMSTDEALASVKKFNRHIYVAAPLIALVVALVLVFVLRRLLAPLQDAGKKMQQMTDGEEPLAPLAVARQDEIGTVVVNFNRLLTDRLDFEEQLLDSKERLRTVVEYAPEAILVFDLEKNRLVEANSSAEKLFACSRAKLLELGLEPFYAPDQPDGVAPRVGYQEQLQDLLAGENLVFEHTIRNAGGQHLVCEVRARRLPSLQNLVICTYVDITERKHLEDEIRDINRHLESQVLKRTEMLREANLSLEEQIGERKAAEAAALDYADRLQTMSRRLIVVQEDERRHLARELHDRVSSGLSAIGLELKIVGKQLSEDALALLHEHLSDCAALLEDTQASARDISADLHPAILDYAGLCAALEDFGRKFCRRTGIPVDVSQSSQTIRLPADKELALFRIAQEALANCAKHSHAKSVAIHLAYDGPDEHAELTISDDGQGFDASQLGQRGSDKSIGLGLLAMQERAEAIGGKCRVESISGKGTRVIVDVWL